eukprot:4005498-Pyramimonas_sp.AAC.1
MGPFTAGVASWESDAFREMIACQNLVLTNAWSEPTTGRATCFCDGRYEPMQIDFIAVSSQVARRSYDCQARHCAAWKSDHCPL